MGASLVRTLKLRGLLAKHEAPLILHEAEPQAVQEWPPRTPTDALTVSVDLYFVLR